MNLGPFSRLYYDFLEKQKNLELSIDEGANNLKSK